MRHLLLLAALLIPQFASAYSNEAENPNVRLMGYKPAYIIYGRPDAKVQFSFKARIADKSNFYLGYTQLMRWDLFKESSPFTDINFNPEAFYRFSLDDDFGRWIDVGYEHESNGKAGDTSRSWDRLYVLFSAKNKIAEETRLLWSLKAWAVMPWDMDPTNRNIARYRGWYEANVTLLDFARPIFDRTDLTLRIYPGGPLGIDPTKGGQEITIRANKWPQGRVLPMLVFQLFHGYGESLLNYNQRVTAIRGGFGF